MKELSGWLLTRAADLKGFSASSLRRMKQFYETYADTPKLAALLRILPRDAARLFKDNYLLHFLDLPECHSEADLQTSLTTELSYQEFNGSGLHGLNRCGQITFAGNE